MLLFVLKMNVVSIEEEEYIVSLLMPNSDKMMVSKIITKVIIEKTYMYEREGDIKALRT